MTDNIARDDWYPQSQDLPESEPMSDQDNDLGSKEPTLSQIAYSVYVLGMNLNGKCVYCRENMSGDKPKYKKRHYMENHYDLSK